MGETVRASSAMTQAQELTAHAEDVYKNERPHALLTFELLLAQQVIAQKQPRSNVNPEQYAINEGYKAAEKRDELNATLKDSILTMLKSGIPLDFIQVLANDDQMNFTTAKKKLFLAHVKDAAETYDRLRRTGCHGPPLGQLAKSSSKPASTSSTWGERWDKRNEVEFASSSSTTVNASGRDNYTRHTLPTTTLRITAATPLNQTVTLYLPSVDGHIISGTMQYQSDAYVGTQWNCDGHVLKEFTDLVQNAVVRDSPIKFVRGTDNVKVSFVRCDVRREDLESRGISGSNARHILSVVRNTMVTLTDADVWESNNRALDRFASSSPWEECGWKQNEQRWTPENWWQSNNNPTNPQLDWLPGWEQQWGSSEGWKQSNTPTFSGTGSSKRRSYYVLSNRSNSAPSSPRSSGTGIKRRREEPEYLELRSKNGIVYFDKLEHRISNA